MMEYLIVCIGRRDSGDDAVGPYIADELQENITDTFGVLDTGTVPENYTSMIKRYQPAHLILVDAVDMHLDPGEIRIVPKEKIGQMHISTHGIPLSVIMNYLETFVDKSLFKGTCYKASNWIYLGDTKGLGKDSQTKIVNRSIKAVLGYPLVKDFKKRLCNG